MSQLYLIGLFLSTYVIDCQISNISKSTVDEVLVWTGFTVSTADAKSMTLSLLRIFDNCSISSLDLMISPLLLLPPPAPRPQRINFYRNTSWPIWRQIVSIRKRLVHLSVFSPNPYPPLKSLSTYYLPFHLSN